MTPPTRDIPHGIGSSPATRVAKRHAIPWTEDEFDFSVRRRGSRTIMLERIPAPVVPVAEPETSAADGQPDRPFADRVAAALVAVARTCSQKLIGAVRTLGHLGRDPREVAAATAAELDRAGAAVGERAREMGEKGAAVAQAGAERVNHVRRAGLPPLRERHIEQPRITPPVSIRRPRRGLYERIGAHPDRVMLWAIGFGIFLIVIAATSA